MSFEFYTGTGGSGKSLHMAYEIINLLKIRKNVIANFPIDLSYFKKQKIGNFTYIPNDMLIPLLLYQYAEKNHKPNKENQTTVFIDECSCMFNPRDYKNPLRREWIELFSQYRKLGYNFVLVAQHSRLCDKQILGFVDTEIKHRAIKRYKTFGWIVSLIFGGLFCYVEVWYGVNDISGKKIFRCQKKKAQIYNTFEKFTA